MAGVSPLFGVLFAALFALLGIFMTEDTNAVDRSERGPNRPPGQGARVKTRSKADVLEEIRSRPLICDHRKVESVEKTIRQKEGGGFYVRRPTLSTEQFDPILLLDHLGPTTYGPKEAVGAPDHPHRGQETITYILEGKMQHLDSHGHKGELSPGDVQWMTAGAGVVHSEMPADDVYEQGGTIEGFQMWVNLPRDKKMTPPRYQELRSADIPFAKSEDGLLTVKVIAGKFRDAEAKIDTVAPVVYFDVFGSRGGKICFDPNVERVFAYVYRGAARFGSDSAKEGEIVLFADTTGDVAVSSESDDFGALLFGGNPLNEPVAWMGPFVMNTQSELQTAVMDFKTGKLGSIPGAEKRFEQTDAANRQQKA